MAYECFPLRLHREGVISLCFSHPQFVTIEMLLHACHQLHEQVDPWSGHVTRDSKWKMDMSINLRSPRPSRALYTVCSQGYRIPEKGYNLEMFLSFRESVSGRLHYSISRGATFHSSQNDHGGIQGDVTSVFSCVKRHCEQIQNHQN